MHGRSSAAGWTRRVLASGTVVLMVLALLAPSLAVAAGSSVTITESGERYHFTPATRTITVGQVVRWGNSTDAPHTITSTGSGPLDSPVVNPGGQFEFTFSRVGTFAYHCSIHSYMQGTVHVVAAHQPPPNQPPGATPLPSTDSVASGVSRHEWLLVLIGIATFSLMLLFGGRLRRRNA